MIVVITQADADIVLTVPVPGSGSSLVLPNAWLMAQRAIPVALTDAPSITVDLLLSNNFTLLLSGNHTLANPATVLPGQGGQIVVTQGAPGGWILTYSSMWKFRLGVPPSLSSDSGAMDILSYYVADASHITVSAGLGFA